VSDGRGVQTVAPGAVLLSVERAALLWRLVVEPALRERVTRGQAVHPDVADVAAALRGAALALRDVLPAGPRPGTSPPPAGPLWWTTEQAAEQVGCTPRHFRRLADAHGITAASRGRWSADDVRSIRRTAPCPPDTPPARTPPP
jgi:hypothetical protein